jgi:hypothetical protein
MQTVPFTHHTKDSDWEILAQRKTIERLCALFKAYSGKRAWKAIRDRMQRLYCLGRVRHCRENRNRKQGTDIGIYAFVNSAIKNWNQLPAIALEAYHCKPKNFYKDS